MTTNAESIAAYAGTKERITGLVVGLDEAAAAALGRLISGTPASGVLSMS